MPELNGKEKRTLRGLGQSLQPMCVIGRGGLTPAVAARIDDLLQRHELVKIRMPAAAASERKAIAEEAAAACNAACAGVVGRTALLYRPNPDLPADTRILLA